MGCRTGPPAYRVYFVPPQSVTKNLAGSIPAFGIKGAADEAVLNTHTVNTARKKPKLLPLQ